MIQGVGSVAGAYGTAQGQRAQGEYNEKLMELNAKMSDFQAEDAIRRGDKAAQDHLKRTQRMIGSQRASLAAQGITIDTGSAAEVQADTAEIGAQDAMMIKNNAWREAWGFKVQGEDMRSRGRFARLAGDAQATQSLLGGGMKAAAHFADASTRWSSDTRSPSAISQVQLEPSKSNTWGGESYYDPRGLA